MTSRSNQPNTTLYINNLNDRVNKQELRLQLYAMFATYGKVVDVVASKTPKMRGQAFLVFTDLAGATAAMRACEGMVFYEKPLHIDYAKTKSYATLKREDPNFVAPLSLHANQGASPGVNGVSSEKRLREEDATVGGSVSKKEKIDEDEDEDEEEMEIDDDDEAATQNKNLAPAMPVLQRPSARLLCTNLPQEVTDDVLSVLFQQYRGFQKTHVTQSPTPNVAGTKVKVAQVMFDTAELASVAKDALDGFTLKKGWKMSVVYI